MENSALRHQFWQRRDKPIMFCHIIGEESPWKEGDEKVALQSKLNEMEASHVVCRISLCIDCHMEHVAQYNILITS